MNLRQIVGLSALTGLSLSLMAMATIAPAQPRSLKDQVVGAWELASAQTTNKDGSTVHSFGPNPKGMVIFEANGRYVQVNLSASLPKFASGNRMKGTADENRAVVQGSISYYGTWHVDEAAKLMVQRVEANSYALHTGTEYKRPISKLTADELVFTNPVSSAGGGFTVLSFRRAR